MNWNEVISILPLVIEDLKKEYLLINPMIRDDIFGILEKHCVVVYYPLENESNCGFHTKRFVKNKLEDFVYINTAKPVANQVFAAAHELGHVWRVADKVIEKMSDKVSFSSEEEELLINRFAAELLMPEKEFRKTFNVRMKEFNLDGKKIKLEDLIRVVVVLMNDYMVPYESVRRRFVETNIISNEMGFYMDKHREIIGVLVACNVMEAAGTGFDIIMEEYASADETHKPFIYSTSDHFTLVLSDLTYDKGVENKMAPVLSFAPVPGGTEHDARVLSFCYFKAHKVSEIAEYLGISDSTYFRKQVLDNLEKHGYLEKSRVSRAAFYKTIPDMVNLE